MTSHGRPEPQPGDLHFVPVRAVSAARSGSRWRWAPHPTRQAADLRVPFSVQDVLEGRRAAVVDAAPRPRRQAPGPDRERSSSPPVTKRVDCAVEFERADAEELPVGNFRPTKATVTLLDEEYDQVKGARELVYNGDRYVYGYEPVGWGCSTSG